jgi:nitrile hydratase
MTGPDDNTRDNEQMAQQAHPAHPHMQDFEAHIKAVEEDLEYYRTKRFEPRLFLLHRRGLITLYDILRANQRVAPPAKRSSAAGPQPDSLERRIRALEDRLDEYVRGIALVSSDVRGDTLVIEDTRKERGDYDPSFRIAKRPHGGSLAERVERLERDLAESMLLLQAFTRALIESGATTEQELEWRRAALTENKGRNGARIVARAWVDPAFKRDLIERGREAVRELDIPPGRLGKLGVAENTETLHNVVVCTLCSCYPHDLLGDTPWWYKHDDYKQRIVRDPRATLAEMFGLQVPENVAIRVHDSTSDVRWMVLPRRPAGTEGMTAAELAELVTRESLIGVAEPRQPSELAGATGRGTAG